MVSSADYEAEACKRHPWPDWTPGRREEDFSEDQCGGPNDDRCAVGWQGGQLLKGDRIDLEEHHTFESRRRRTERAKAGGTTAKELMSSPAITIRQDANVRDAAKVMHDQRVKRLPVVDGDDRLVGVISRSDVLQVFLRPDDEIRREIVEDVVQRTVLLDTPALVIKVAGAVVTTTGEVDRKSDARILTRLTAAVPGVVTVESHIRYRYDDEKRRLQPGLWTGTV